MEVGVGGRRVKPAIGKLLLQFFCRREAGQVGRNAHVLAGERVRFDHIPLGAGVKHLGDREYAVGAIGKDGKEDREMATRLAKIFDVG